MLSVKLPKGKYIVAVSGGVDSMVLLDILRQTPGVSVVVAHVNHGVRADSHKDEALVRRYAKTHGLVFVSKKLQLSRHSEQAMRQARRSFLQQCRKKVGARAIVTAHHQDDLIETVIINIIRGTGWRGLAPFLPADDFIKPLVYTTKNDLIAYARKHTITWREDSTNSDQNYLRNYVRHTVVPLLNQKSDSWQTKLLQQVRKQQALRVKIEQHLAKNVNKTLGRHNLIMMPSKVATEVLQATIKNAAGENLERPQAFRALVFTKVARPHKIMPVAKGWQLRATMRNVIVEPRPNVIR